MSARTKVSAPRTIRRAGQRARDAFEVGLRDLEQRLPRNLRATVREMRENLRVFQDQLDRARQNRDARWRRIETQVRRDLVRLLQRLEKVIAPRAASARPARARASTPRRRKKR